MGVFYNIPVYPPTWNAAVTPPTPHVPITTAQAAAPPPVKTLEKLLSETEVAWRTPFLYPQKLVYTAIATSQAAAPPPVRTLEKLFSETEIAWRTPFLYPQKLVYLPISNSQANTPPPLNLPNHIYEILQSWAVVQQPFQFIPKYIPQIVVYVPVGINQIMSLINSWLPPFVMPQTLIKIAPLTLSYGQNPPLYSIAELMEILVTPSTIQIQQPTIFTPQIISVFVPYNVNWMIAVIQSWQTQLQYPQQLAKLIQARGGDLPPLNFPNHIYDILKRLSEQLDRPQQKRPIQIVSGITPINTIREYIETFRRRRR